MSNNYKRSFVSEERLKELNRENSVYVVSCINDEYYCKNHLNNICLRGFFSLYLQTVYGILFADKYKLPYFIDFGNLTYPYSGNELNGKKNFWESYFSQEESLENKNLVINQRTENYPLRVWDRNFAKEVKEKVINKIKILPNLEKEILEIQSSLINFKTLGVHIRRTDHFGDVRQVENKVYFDTLDREIENFEKLFVATDDLEVLHELKERYPDKLVFNDFTRSLGQVGVHNNPNPEKGYLLGKEAILDCYTLASCNKVILSPSNLSYASFLINPELKYKIIESWEAKFHRWKTLTAYYLDKWGIRKW